MATFILATPEPYAIREWGTETPGELLMNFEWPCIGLHEGLKFRGDPVTY